MIVLISRGYVTRRAGTARALAAIAAGALIAGCGGSTPPANTSAATPTPVVSSSGAAVGDQATGSGNGGGSGSSAVAGNISGGTVGTISHSSTPVLGVSHSVVTHVTTNSQVMSAAQAKKLQQQASQTTTPTKTTATPPTKTTPQNQPSTGSSAPPPAKTRVITVTRTRIFTVYRNRTITKTITKTVAPKVPAGAYMPSKNPELAQSVFTIKGSNIGCVIAQSGVRCGITHRSWTSPAQPKSCKSKWGSTLALAGKGLPQFACGGSNPLNPGAKVIPPGWDTTVGDFTCQVRSFGVDCFDSKSNSGFMISRTGYSIY